MASLPDFRRLMRAAALRLGRLVNQSGLARDCGLAQAPAHRWLNLLEASFMLVRVPSYAVNRTKRLVKHNPALLEMAQKLRSAFG